MGELVRWLGDIIQGKRNPHWVHLFLPSLALSVGFFAYVRSLNLAFARVPDAVYNEVVLVGLGLAAFFVLFTLLLMHFNARAKDTQSAIVVFNGELRYEDEIHIALHVGTFKNLIASMAAKSKSDANALLRESGLIAGRGFGKQFPTIYADDLLDKGRGVEWRHLSLQDRLNLWSDFDKGAGWGRFSVIERDKEILVNIQHVSLFNGAGGALIAQFMAGYVMGVTEHIVGAGVKAVGDLEITGPQQNSVLIRLALNSAGGVA